MMNAESGAAPTSRQPVLVEDVGSVRVVTLNRPDRRNALDVPDRQVLMRRLRAADNDAKVRAVVLVGADGIFSAGGDIVSMDAPAEELEERLQLAGELARTILMSATPIVAAVEGGAFGMGLSVVAACDLVVAASGAQFVVSFTHLGLIGDTGFFWSMRERIGAGRTREALMLGTSWKAEEALNIGLVNEVVPEGKALARGIDLAQALAQASPQMIASIKSILAQAEWSLEAVLAAEGNHQSRLLQGEEFARRRAAFLDRKASRTIDR